VTVAYSGFRHVEPVMGTAVSFDVRTPDCEASVRGAVEFLHWVDQTFSVYRADSQICTIGRGELAVDDAHPQVREVLVRCGELREATDGWYDHEGGGDYGRRLDPSGYVKGWSIDRAAELLRFDGLDRFCINAGGDVVAVGRPDGRNPWRVGIRKPGDAAGIATVVAVADAAVATSGTYERGEHIWSPRSGPPVGPSSVTIMGPQLGVADALATAVFAAGDDAPGWLHRFPEYRLLVA
jgi:thiamine biosynthesis lipoprotein